MKYRPQAGPGRAVSPVHPLVGGVYWPYWLADGQASTGCVLAGVLDVSAGQRPFEARPVRGAYWTAARVLARVLARTNVLPRG